MPHCRTDGQDLTCGRSLQPPCRAAGRPTASPPGGEYLPPECRTTASPKGQNVIKNKFYLYFRPYCPAGGRPPHSRTVGI